MWFLNQSHPGEYLLKVPRSPEVHHGLRKQNTWGWGRATGTAVQIVYYTASTKACSGIGCSLALAFLTICMCESWIHQGLRKNSRTIVLKCYCTAEWLILRVKIQIRAMLDLTNQDRLGRSLGICIFKKLQSQFCCLRKCKAMFSRLRILCCLQETKSTKLKRTDILAA